MLPISEVKHGAGDPYPGRPDIAATTKILVMLGWYGVLQIRRAVGVDREIPIGIGRESQRRG